VNFELINRQIIPASYQNEARLIEIPGLHPKFIPGSPEDIRIPVAPSSVVSPLLGSSNATTTEPITTTMANLELPAASVSAEHPLSKD
jgi:hypothetical protein